MICYLSRNYKEVGSAGNKAKTDVEQIMDNLGFCNVGMKQTRYSNVVLAFLYTLLSIIMLVFRLRKGSVLVLQYPLKKYYTFVCNVAHLRGCKVITLIHDLGSFRSKRITVATEISRLNHSDCIIVHSQRMKDWLIDKDCKSHLEILEIFDYLSETSSPQTLTTPTKPYHIVFAGVLASRHNDFLYQVANSPRTYGMTLYGGEFEPEHLQNMAEVIYKGFVSSDDLIATAEGEFGVVWYGPSLVGGGGPLGEYLQYNAPHKMSLYIRCGLPVIIWEKAGLASFVKENKIGILIHSLEELEGVFSVMTREQYMEMKTNVMAISERLSHGYYFSKAVRQACKDMNMEEENL